MKLLCASAAPASPGKKKRRCLKSLAVALFVFASMMSESGQAQPVLSTARPEKLGKPAPLTAINYTVTEAFPHDGKIIAAVNRSSTPCRCVLTPSHAWRISSRLGHSEMSSMLRTSAR